VPCNIDAVSAAIEPTFNNGRELGFAPPAKFSSNDKFQHFYLFARNAGVFPNDFQVRVHSKRDPALRRYSKLPPVARSRDFYLYEPSGDYYWDSEYFYDGAPVKFRCSFIIHLESLSSTRTQVQVLEYIPIIWIGQAFDPLGHVWPGFYDDIREVEPTISDRAEVLQLVIRAASSGAIADPPKVRRSRRGTRDGADPLIELTIHTASTAEPLRVSESLHVLRG
jgi:hypothetical protein